MTWRAEYEAYLASPEWQLKRSQVMQRCKGVCENCGEATARTVHHLSYRRMGNEPLVDLVAVCDDCHGRLHSRPIAHDIIGELSSGELLSYIDAAAEKLHDKMLKEADEVANEDQRLDLKYDRLLVAVVNYQEYKEHLEILMEALDAQESLPPAGRVEVYAAAILRIRRRQRGEDWDARWIAEREACLPEFQVVP